MKNKKKLILGILIIIFVLLQIYPSEKPSVTIDNPNDLIVTDKVPEAIALKLKTACYDCHSNKTKFPWYSNIAPMKWLIYDHINHGREELNFSEWNTLTIDDKADALDDISSMILDGDMPLSGYVKFHSEAKLSEADREAIAAWADDMLDSLYE